MTLRLQLSIKPVHRADLLMLAAQVWSVLKGQVFLDDATHFALGHRSRGTAIAKIGNPIVADNDAVAVFSGSSRYDGAHSVSLRFRHELDLSLSWKAVPADLLDRCEALCVALDVVLGDQAWFFFSGLDGDYGARLRPDPPRWHRWLHGPRILDVLDTRLPGVVDTLREIPLPSGVTCQAQGHLVFVRWCDALEPALRERAACDREQPPGRDVCLEAGGR
ncbi:MAG: hypothetical protein ACI8RZ_003708 [Myxococcota bacterium]|jgi:hypothetical protein